MRAITYAEYGSPEVLKLSEIEKPTPTEKQILIKMQATTVNSGDVRLRKADPFLVRLMFGLLKPKISILGNVISGVVEEIGKEVSLFKVGDEVFGLNDFTMGTYAEYLVVPEGIPLAHKPSNMNFEEAASTVFGGHTALHFLKKAKIQNGQKVLIYGASGAVGSSAVQLAKYYGAHVTAVCSTVNLELVKSLGADSVIDYTKDDLSSLQGSFDVVFDTVDKIPVSKIAKLSKNDGTLILSAALIKGMLQGVWIAKTSKIKVIAGVVEVTSQDMNFIRELAENGSLKPVIDRTYPLDQMQAAHEYVDKGHKKGNVVVKI